MTALSQKLAALLSTGNNTHTAVAVPRGTQALAIQFNVTAIGATPTVTYEVKGSDDGTTFVPVAYITSSGGAISTGPRTRTTVSAEFLFITTARDRLYPYYRLVTTANTNVTYDADLITFEPSG